MKKANKIVLIASLACVGAGVITACCAWGAMGFSLRGTNEAFEKTVYSKEGSFSCVSFETVSDDVKFLPAVDDKYRVECYESEKMKYDVGISGDTLNVSIRDERKWYEKIGLYNFAFTSDKHDLKIYLPSEEYKKVTGRNVSGNIEIPEGFTISQAEVMTVSGDTVIKSNIMDGIRSDNVSGTTTIGSNKDAKVIINGNINLHSVSGIVDAHVTEASDVTIESVSGRIKLDGNSFSTLKINTVSGNISANIISEGTEEINRADIKSISGNVELKSFEAGKTYIETISGDIDVDFMSDKSFTVISDFGGTLSGTMGGTWTDTSCEIQTNSGDVIINGTDAEKLLKKK